VIDPGLGAGAIAADEHVCAKLEVGGSDNTFFTPGEFDMDKLLTFWAERIDQGGADGYETVRLTADAAWWQPQFPRGEMSSRRKPAGG
jgi:hypothetical protein